MPHVLSPDDVACLTRPLLGLRVAEAWRGHGAALCLELGRLARREGEPHARGTGSLLMEWSWQVVGSRGRVAGSWAPDGRVTAVLRGVVGRRVTALTVSGPAAALTVTLDGNRQVHAVGPSGLAPQWTLFLPDGTWLAVEDGRVVHDCERAPRRLSGPARRVSGPVAVPR